MRNKTRNRLVFDHLITLQFLSITSDMRGYLERELNHIVTERLKSNPAVAILGPRQCGKTTLAKHIVRHQGAAVYLDLEHPSDLAKLADPVAFFELHGDELICLDEIQRAPGLFQTLRAVIDQRNTNGQFLVLGSASPELIRQSSESLAGRISTLELSPFMLPEVAATDTRMLRELWLRGGFPRSFLAKNLDTSFQWRDDFTRTFLERDIGMLGFKLSPTRLGRFWRMCAHLHGTLLNASKLADSLGVSSHTVRSYLDIFEGAFMVRLLRPDAPNLKKRLAKSPKVFIRDSGVLHSLLAIRSHDDLLSHPVVGTSFEGFAMENILAYTQGWDPTFYRTSAGAELDLVLRRGRTTLVFEFKASSAPRVSRGFWSALEDIEPDEAHVVAPVDEVYPLRAGVKVTPLSQAIARLKAI